MTPSLLFDVLSSLLDDQISQEKCAEDREDEVVGPIQGVLPSDRHLFPPEGTKTNTRLLFRDPGDDTPWNVAVLWLLHNYEPAWLSEPDVGDQPVSGRKAVEPFPKTEAPDEVPDSRLREYMMHRRAFNRGLSMPANKGITRDLIRFEKHGAVQKLIEHLTKYFPANPIVAALSKDTTFRPPGYANYDRDKFIYYSRYHGSTWKEIARQLEARPEFDEIGLSGIQKAADTFAHKTKLLKLKRQKPGRPPGGKGQIAK